MTGDATTLMGTRDPASGALRTTPPFVVLLGTDYAGKSSALTELADHAPSWHIVSLDDDFLESGHSLIGRLRRNLVADVLPDLHHGYSLDFMVSLLQTATVHLRDSIERSPGGAPVLVDSYYYKILAKCRLAGVDRHPVFDWWRTFPQPHRVVFLEVSTTTAWQRCGEGAWTNSLEYYGEQPDQASFEKFQSDLRAAMWEEVQHLPVTVVEEQEHVSRTVQILGEVMDREIG
ncbi:hypothetical protein NGF19_19215 [Streptomyces sp. RY43-2]|uniref:Thymidylate kinase n=1 Tax=Streptomyces macrolidinus TaxID=2952607 RepID=A0ABT0ZH40_9ACTN|nr:hypothetical protein [Streptomyces macrolidinus]MCN9242900.1 hypothetical protein [Streptomyces macrolidinus]